MWHLCVCFDICDLPDGEVDEEVDAAVDRQAEVAHPQQPAGKWDYSR